MRPEAKKYLIDISKASSRIGQFMQGLAYDDYRDSELVQAAVERQFLIIGEALAQLARVDPAAVSQVSDYGRIIGFRNVLAHNYGDVQTRLVWDAIELRLPLLREEVRSLLDEG